MKKHFVLLLALVLCIGLLSGCGTKEINALRTHEDLAIAIPSDFMDLSDRSYAKDLDFLYGLDPIAVNGLREEKAHMIEHGYDLNLEGYANLILLSNKISTKLTKKDGICTFSYDTDGYTYVVTIWETHDAFWTVQAYCPTQEYPQVSDQMWKILSSVTV